MPEDSKKSHHKAKHEAKEQRKPRQPRQQGGERSEKKTEKKVEEPKVPVTQAPKPVYEDPGPEFYKNLKRETDEILKIAEEANTKYKKKEIQSNWTKYEMPIETYDEIEEQENLGADYEKLVSAPLSLGGHFQFKHEKSWDVDTGPSLYDKYFDINMENLAMAINTVPFYERNNIDLSVFSQNDIESMNSRAVKYKRKYYKDKSYTTVELEVQDNINNLLLTKDDTPEVVDTQSQDSNEMNDIVLNQNSNKDLNPKSISNVEIETVQKEMEKSKIQSPEPVKETIKDEHGTGDKVQDIDDIDDILLEATTSIAKVETKILGSEPKGIDKLKSTAEPQQSGSKEVESNAQQEKREPIIESPEDLEKWLDDFLEG